MSPSALPWEVTSVWPWGQAVADVDGLLCSQTKRMPISYVSIQGCILKQADSYSLLSVVVVVCRPYGEDTETCSGASLICCHNLIMEVATTGWILWIRFA